MILKIDYSLENQQESLLLFERQLVLVGFEARYVFQVKDQSLRVTSVSTGASKDFSLETLGSHSWDSLKFNLELLPDPRAIDPDRIEAFRNKVDYIKAQGTALDDLVFQRTLKHGLSVSSLLLLSFIWIPLETQKSNSIDFSSNQAVSISQERSQVIAKSYLDSISKAEALQKSSALESARSQSQPSAKTQKGMKAAFASLFSTKPSGNSPSPAGRSDSVDPLQRVMALPKGMAVGTGGQDPNSANSIVKISAVAGGGGYGSGSSSGIGGEAGAYGVSGQGQGVLSLNLKEAFVDDGLSRDEVGKVIHSKISEIRYCYESSMIHRPEIEGKLVVDFVIGPKGSVASASIKESSVGDELLNECILKRLSRWSFPSPRSNVEVAVSYPFIFKRLRR